MPSIILLRLFWRAIGRWLVHRERAHLGLAKASALCEPGWRMSGQCCGDFFRAHSAVTVFEDALGAISFG